MSANRLLGLLLFGLLALALWFFAGDTEPAVTVQQARDVPDVGDDRVPAALKSVAAEAAVANQVESQRERAERVAAPPREWKLRVHGTVVSADEEDVVIAGAELDLVVFDQDGERSFKVPRQLSDELGAYSFELAIDPSWYDSEGESLEVLVELSAWAPGHYSDLFEEDVELVEVSELELEVDLTQGAEVVGYVFDSKGDPVEAEVRIESDDGGFFDFTEADEHGYYELPIPGSAVVSVTARSPSSGTGVLAQVSIDAAVRTRLPDLYLAGSGVIGGVLLDPDGQPIASHAVGLVLEELIGGLSGPPQEWDFELGQSQRNRAAERGDGRVFASQRTRFDGSFLFEGLRPGRYLVLARHASGGKQIETERRLYSTGELDVRLVLGVYRLKVLTKSGGRASTIHCHEWTEAHANVLSSAPTVALHSLLNSKLGLFEVEVGRTYLVGLGDGDAFTFSFGEPGSGPWKLVSGEKKVHIEEGRYLTTVSIDDEGESSRLFIDIEDPESPYSYGVQIHSVSLGRRIRTGYIMRKDLPLEVELAPGHYRVSVDSTGFPPFRFGGPISTKLVPINSGPSEPVESEAAKSHVSADWREIEVGPGQSLAVHFRFGVGGRLRIAIPAPEPVEAVFLGGIGIALPDFSSFSTAVDLSEFELENGRGERTRSLSFKPRNSLAQQDSNEPRWRELSRVLPTGAYVLRWRDAEEKLLERRFVIREGELTSVNFESR